MALGSDRHYENQHIPLLTHIRTVFDHYDKDRLRTKGELIRRWRVLNTARGANGPAWTARRPAHADARRNRPLVTPLRHQIEDALAAGTTPENEIRERIFPSAIRGGMGLLLRTKRHTATGKQNQVLVAAREPPHARHTFQVLPPETRTIGEPGIRRRV